jgi:hypothetical protein
MKHDQYFLKMQTESMIGATHLQIKQARHMLRVSQELLGLSRARLSHTANYS